jgi:hypothetical protein
MGCLIRISNNLIGGHQRHSVAISILILYIDSDSVDTSSLEDHLPLAQYDYRHQFIKKHNKNHTPPNLLLLPTLAILPANTTFTTLFLGTAVFSISRTSSLYVYYIRELDL